MGSKSGNEYGVKWLRSLGLYSCVCIVNGVEVEGVVSINTDKKRIKVHSNFFDNKPPKTNPTSFIESEVYPDSLLVKDDSGNILLEW